ncbi:MAG: starch-binding outer membrane lipoprotein SusD [Bacteroidaceae bacterium]|nr:starch-binding outer membrane lipoprotein SusD [Bacteroidaceae bacterium]
MKKIFKTLFVAFAAVMFTSCWNDLDISSIDPQSSPTYDDMQLLAKAYGTLGLTGQQGPAGKGDISSDEGESGFYRTTFNLEVLPTDECNWAWQTDTDIPQITGISWSSSSQRTQWCYQRLGFDIVLFNTYLKETASQTSQDYQYYRAEVRFLRALHYWYFLDLWHKAPFKDENDEAAALPVPKEGIDLYNWIDQELTAIESELAPVGTFCTLDNFGRVDQGAAWLLHARLALNSEIYTDNQVNDLAKAKTYATRLIDSGKYKLAAAEKGGYSGYAQLFMADNDENMEAIQEIILPIRQDGVHTRCYSAANYLISSTRISGMPYAGTSNCWSCNYARPDLVEKFFPNDDIPMAKDDETAMNTYKKLHKIFSFKIENGDTLYLFKTTDETEVFVVDKITPRTADGTLLTGEYVVRDFTESELIAYDEYMKVSTKDVLKAAGDDRALFYSGFGGGIRKIRTDKLNNFLDGISIVKFQNYRSDGAATKDAEWPDMDIPLLRFAEAYMIRAEVNFRDGNTAEALTDINVLRTRAHAQQLSELTESELLDEWCREFYMEGRRRSDLNRFGRFVGGSYIWAWKGGVANGQSVDSHFRFYPIPQDDINNNENLSGSQNPGY